MKAISSSYSEKRAWWVTIKMSVVLLSVVFSTSPRASPLSEIFTRAEQACEQVSLCKDAKERHADKIEYVIYVIRSFLR